MRAGLGMLIIVVFIIGAIGYAANRNENNKKDDELSIDDVNREVKSGAATLYDVRTPEEFAEGYFTGAKSWPLQDIEDGKYPQIDKGSKIYLYCRSGNRSNQAEQLLKKAGYTNITNLGGLEDVKALGGQLIN